MIKITDRVLDKYVKGKTLSVGNQNYLADMFLPEITVEQPFGLFPSWGDAHMRVYDLERSVEDKGMHYIDVNNGEDVAYQLKSFDAAAELTLKKIKDMASVTTGNELIKQLGMTTSEALKLQRDVALATLITSTAILTNNTTLSGTSQYSDYNNSTPAKDIEDGKLEVFKKVHVMPNSMYISLAGAMTLKQHPDYVNQFTGIPAMMSDDQLIQALKSFHGFKNVYIGSTMKITSAQGQATVTKDFVFGDDIVLFVRPDQSSIFNPSFGYSLRPKGNPKYTKSWLEPSNQKSYNVESGDEFQDKILMADAAYLIKDII